MSDKNQPAKDGNDSLYIMFAVVIIILVLWYVNHTLISSAVIFFKKAEIWLFAQFGPRAARVYAALGATNPEALSMKGLANLLAATGAAMAPYGTIVCGILAGVYWWRVPKFRGSFTIPTLIKSEMRIWPTIAPASIKGIISQPLTQGPWATALTEWEFAKLYNLAYDRASTPIYDFATRNLIFVADKVDLKRLKAVMLADVNRKRGEGYTVAIQAGLIDRDGVLDTRQLELSLKSEEKALAQAGRLNVDRAQELLELQLGPRWEGFSKLSPVMRAVAASLVLRIVGDRDKSMDALDRMALDFTKACAKNINKPEPIDYSWADPIIAQHQNHPDVKKVIAAHAYVYTVFAGMVVEARAGRSAGVFSSSWLKWLRTMDRRLWYTINAVGRYAFFVECVGIMSHYLYEKRVGHAVMPRMVKYGVSYSHNRELVAGLEFALNNFKPGDGIFETESLLNDGTAQVIEYGHAPEYASNIDNLPQEAYELANRLGMARLPKEETA